MSGCWSLLLLEEVSLMMTGYILKYGNIIRDYFIDFFSRLVVLGFTLSLWAIQVLVLGPPSSVGYRFLLMEWALGSNQTLIGYSHNFCATIALAYYAGRTDCRSKVLWLGWCLSVAYRVPSCTKGTRV